MIENSIALLRHATGLTIGTIVLSAAPAFGQNTCATGAVPLANAYVRANVIYAMYIGEPEEYIRANRAHFTANGDAIQCARVLADAMVRNSVRTYDADSLRRQQEVNVRLQTLGASPSTPVGDASSVFFFMGQQLWRLAEAMPRVANGGPLQGHLSPEQEFAVQLLQILLQDPSVSSVFVEMEPLIREAANSEFRLLVSIATNL